MKMVNIWNVTDLEYGSMQLHDAVKMRRGKETNLENVI